MRIIYKQYPRCESKDTLKIIYGMPKEELWETGDYWLGGCCIEVDEEGESVGPEYYCKKCGYEWNKKQAVKDWYSAIEFIKLWKGGFFVRGEIRGLDLQYGSISKEDETFEDLGDIRSNNRVQRTLSPQKVSEIIDKLISVNFLQWKRSYIDEEVLDGEQWEIEYVIKGRKKNTTGSNDYLEGWEKFIQPLEDF